MKNLRRIGVALVLVLIGIQFIRPDLTNPVGDPARSIEASMSIPEDIRAIMTRACADCHSHHTIWPWYSRVAPISWLVVSDVNKGRKHFNFSEWGTYKKSRMSETLSQMAVEVDEENMPMPPYILFHAEASLTREERNRFANWAEEEADKISSGEDEEENKED